MDNILVMFGIADWGEFFLHAFTASLTLSALIGVIIQLGFVAWAYIDDSSSGEVCKSFGKRLSIKGSGKEWMGNEIAALRGLKLVERGGSDNYGRYLVPIAPDTGDIWQFIGIRLAIAVALICFSPLLLGPLLPITVGLVITVVLLKLTRFAMRTKKALGKHIGDKEAHQ